MSGYIDDAGVLHSMKEAVEKLQSYDVEGEISAFFPIQPRKRGKISKRTPFGRILKTEYRDGREWQLHSTKGWRSHRVLPQ